MDRISLIHQNYVQQFVPFNHFRYELVANYKGELRSRPFDMNTFYQMWGVNTAEEVREKLEHWQKNFLAGHPERH